jgi:putative addiction module CopG family antidote
MGRNTLMTIHLPEELEHYLQAKVSSGRFASEDEAIAQAVRLLRQVEQDAEPPAQKPMTEEEFQQHLVAIGMMSSVPPPRDPNRPRREFRPVEIEGEPLSETIIRERR